MTISQTRLRLPIQASIYSTLTAPIIMENDSTFVAPEGVYSVTDEHKPNHIQNVAVSAGPALYPAKVSTVVLRFPPAKQGGGPGFAQLLGGGKSESKKKERDDGVSLSSSDTPEESDQPPPSSQEHAAGNTSVALEPHTLFSVQPAAGKKKTVARPKHNLKTTSSTFVTRIQTAEGMSKTLQSKQGDVCFMFYNTAKSFVWIEAGSKAKVDMYDNPCPDPTINPCPSRNLCPELPSQRIRHVMM